MQMSHRQHLQHIPKKTDYWQDYLSSMYHGMNSSLPHKYLAGGVKFTLFASSARLCAVDLATAGEISFSTSLW
jgi:hypothetical protein